jgi:hypoxanthine phosphoribosyltransferase
MKDNMQFKFLTWEDIDNACDNIYKQMVADNYRPTAIIGLLRGGVIPARIFCDYFNVTLDFFTIDVKLYNGIGTMEEKPKIREFEEDLIRGRKILIVDDIIDSAKTMSAVLEHLKEEDIKTATLYCKETAKMKPNYYACVAKENEWISFTWERREFLRETSE